MRLAKDRMYWVKDRMYRVKDRIYRVLVAGLLWWWAAELLGSLQDVAYMGDTRPIVWYIGILLFSQFIPWTAVRRALLAGIVFLLLKWEYYSDVSWLQPWQLFGNLFRDLSIAMQSIPSGNYALVNDGIRTLAFFGVITFGIKLLEEIILRPVAFVAVIAAEELVLAEVAARYQVHDRAAVVLSFVVGFLLLAVVHLPRIRLFSAAPTKWDIARHATLPAAFLAVTAAVGAVVPEAPPHLIQKAGLFSFLGAHAQSTQTDQAYGAHNAALGGPFRGSNHVFLRVYANAPSYYLGEVLQTYTGAGWTSGVDAPSLRLRVGRSIPSALVGDAGFLSGTPVKTVRQKIQVVRGTYPVMFAAYQAVRVSASNDGKHYQVNSGTGTLAPTTALRPGSAYSVTSEEPVPTPAELSRVHDGNLAYAFPEDLQLPSGLPRRDVLLAQRITAGLHGTYAKVGAIIRYLQTHEQYNTTNVPYTQPGQDFVDQFLFVTHRGYCDHFSSALAVLARAVNIPSRWVEGFVSVPASPGGRGRLREYVLRGVDAHSWAEIWFAGYGWIPMEATPSFVLPGANTTPIPAHVTRPVTHPSVPPASRGTKPIPPEGGGAAFPAEVPLAALGVAALAAAAFFLQRRRARFRRRGSSRGEREQRLRASLSRVARRFGERAPGQTLREFALTVREEEGRSELMRFVLLYERLRYGRTGDPQELAAGFGWLRPRRVRRSGSRGKRGGPAAFQANPPADRPM